MYLDLVITLHDLFDPGERELTTCWGAALKVDDSTLSVTALFYEVHVVLPEGLLELVEVLRGMNERAARGAGGGLAG